MKINDKGYLGKKTTKHCHTKVFLVKNHTTKSGSQHYSHPIIKVGNLYVDKTWLGQRVRIKVTIEPVHGVRP